MQFPELGSKNLYVENTVQRKRLKKLMIFSFVDTYVVLDFTNIFFSYQILKKE